MASNIAVVCLPLPPDARQKLLASGYNSTEDLHGVSTMTLASELQVDPVEALKILRAAGCVDLCQEVSEEAKTAIDILAKERAVQKIFTFCSELDAILGGGIATGQVTEICGAPAIGKTQIGMQLAIDVQLPVALGGLDGEALYIDTEGSFTVARACQMAEAYIKHVHRIYRSSRSKPFEAVSETQTWEDILEKIHVLRALDLVEQLSAMQSLEAFVKQHPKVKLVVIDSISFHLRQDVKDLAHRTRLLANLSQDMMRLADRHDVAVRANLIRLCILGNVKEDSSIPIIAMSDFTA